MKSFFITGIDTDCGKTYVTAALGRALIQMNQSVLALKPVASGCERLPGGLQSADARQLALLSGKQAEDINPWRFAAPASPHLAAAWENQVINLRELAEFCDQCSKEPYDVCLVEGAGGLMVPLNETETWVDFLQLTGMPVILVVSIRLGCINHALLTIKALSVAGIPVYGWIANALSPDYQDEQAVIDSLRVRIPHPCLAYVPHQGELQWQEWPL